MVPFILMAACSWLLSLHSTTCNVHTAIERAANKEPAIDSSLVKAFVCRASKHHSAGQDRRSHSGSHQDRCDPGWWTL